MNKLPQYLTPFVGRQVELAQLIHFLTNRQDRLVTIIGMGGIGKTRLAVAAAHRLVQSPTKEIPSDAHGLSMQQRYFVDGIHYVSFLGVSMASKADGLLYEQLATTIGEALDLPFSETQSFLSQLHRYLQDRNLLLLLDNYEEWDKVKPFLCGLLSAAPRLQLLVTSPVALHLQVETSYYLEGLSLPTEETVAEALTNRQDCTPNALLAYDTIALFCARAVQVVPTFALTLDNCASVFSICRTVDSSPLAIELAARLVDFYSCEEIAEQIANDFTLLATKQLDVPPRHQRIQTILDAAWYRLTEEEVQLVVICAHFAAAFTRAAAQYVTSATPEQIRSLIQKRMLHYDGEQQLLRMPALLRQYAMTRREAWPAAVAAGIDRHATYYLNLIREKEEALRADRAILQEIQITWPNVELAWQQSIALEHFLQLAQAASCFAQLLRLQRQFSLAVTHLEAACFALRKRFEEQPSIPLEHALALLLGELVSFYLDLGNEVQATLTATELLAHSGNLLDTPIRGIAYRALARAAHLRSDPKLMLMLSGISCDLLKMAQRPRHLATSLLTRGMAFVMVGDRENAIATMRLAVATLTGPDIELQSYSEWAIGFCYQQERRHMAVLHHLTAAIALGGTFGDLPHLFLAKIEEAEVWQRLGYFSHAKTIIDQLTADTAACTPLMTILLQLQQGRILQATDGPAAAQHSLMSALRIARQVKHHLLEHRACLLLGHLFVELGATIDAQIFYRRAYFIQEWLQLPHGAADIYAGMANLARITGDFAFAKTQAEIASLRMSTAPSSIALDPFWVYWSVIEIFRLDQDPQADLLLQEAHVALQAEADLITDEALRESFLSNVPINRRIIDAIQQQ